MNDFFIMVCILVMWPMLFSVPVLYATITKETAISDTLVMTSVGLFVGFLAWALVGYPIIFVNDGYIWENFSHYYFLLQSGHVETLLNMIIQGCFFLYAAGMFVGTLIHKVRWPFFAVFIPVWMVLVYAPIAFMLWNTQGFFNQLGVLDFSGGLVVHLTAGITSLMLTRYFTEQTIDVPENSSNLAINYIATTLICFGWFGFNLGPLGGVKGQIGLVLLNTVLAICSGCLGFLFVKRMQVQSEDILTGIMVGLVTSTALVGYVSPLQMMFVTFISGLITCIVQINSTIDDPVDSFILNGLGGLIGAVSLILFANPLFTPEGQSGLLSTGTASWFPVIQILGILFVVILSIAGSLISIWITLFFKKRKGVSLIENR
ncbi:ammonium transporter [Marinilactibacillus kalidii]|uniref:ammonium transporter n=1 Tax=Marinilactibacillus kalidii TaxID=2820274 RepID=UPI001ABE1397|nr:ammonium transporter [Marinilactibacillus kalidii]